MNEFELRVNGKLHRFGGPSAFSELTPRQAVGLARIRAGIADQPGLAVAALRLLYGVKPRQLRPLLDVDWLHRQGLSAEDRYWTLAQGAELLATMGWVGEIDAEALFIVNRFRVSDFRFGGPRAWLDRLRFPTRYVGPGHRLEHLSFGQFMWADAAYQNGDLTELAAILFTPNGKPFEAATVEARKRLFEQLDGGLLLVIRDQYEDALHYLGRCFRRVFPRADPSLTPKKRKPQSAGWVEVSLSMAQLDVTKIPAIETTNLYLALKTLDRQLQQAEDLDNLRQK